MTLEGKSGNRMGIGASVSIQSNGVRQTRRIRTGGSYLSSSQIAATFGLGEALEVDSLIVSWPLGSIERYGPFERNTRIRVVEGTGIEVDS